MFKNPKEQFWEAKTELKRLLQNPKVLLQELPSLSALALLGWVILIIGTTSLLRSIVSLNFFSLFSSIILVPFLFLFFVVILAGISTLIVLALGERLPDRKALMNLLIFSISPIILVYPLSDALSSLIVLGLIPALYYYVLFGARLAGLTLNASQLKKPFLGLLLLSSAWILLSIIGQVRQTVTQTVVPEAALDILEKEFEEPSE